MRYVDDGAADCGTAPPRDEAKLEDIMHSVMMRADSLAA